MFSLDCDHHYLKSVTWELYLGFYVHNFKKMDKFQAGFSFFFFCAQCDKKKLQCKALPDDLFEIFKAQANDEVELHWEV